VTVLVLAAPAEYNARVQNFIDKNSFENQNMLLIDKGRTISERSVVMIENGIYKGFAFTI
jgi:DNA polymerase-3 subunit epsilon